MKAKFARTGWLAAILLGSFWAGTCFPPQPAATAEARKGATTQHFLSGSERSIPILQEISGTLKRIEARLSRIEQTVAAAAKQ